MTDEIRKPFAIRVLKLVSFKEVIMGAYVQLAALVIELVFLALVLGLVGYGLNKLITRHLVSRQEEKMKAEALVAGSRARAHARAKATAARI